MSRAHNQIQLVTASSTKAWLVLGSNEWLILGGSVAAVLMEEVYFPDQTFSRATMAAINAFMPKLPHTRVPLADWDYYVASSAMRALRPLLGKSSESDPNTPQAQEPQ